MTFRKFSMMVAVSAISLAALQSTADAQLRFNLAPTGNAQADAGFQAAADFWSSTFDDDIEININSGFASLDDGVIASAGSARINSTFSDVRNALLADATNALDSGFANSLSTTNDFNVLINRTSDNPNGNGSATPYVAQQSVLLYNRANAKAIGLIAADDSNLDAAITFNSDLNFDFDPSDGIGAGQFDFIGVAIHEIGHAMGFTSGVDTLEFNSGRPAANSQFATIFDFARHSADSIAAGAELDLTADSRTKFVSFDGGLTTGAPGINHFSRGARFGGSMRQASHWRDGLGLGIMDPTIGFGEETLVTELDINAFDVIGYNRIVAVPEPGTACTLAVFAIGLLVRRRRS